MNIIYKNLTLKNIADIIKSRIIAEEFAKTNTPPPMGGQGIDMLVPTLLELGTEEQKKKWLPKISSGEISLRHRFN